jgi:hypothetical protein
MLQFSNVTGYIKSNGVKIQEKGGNFIFAATSGLELASLELYNLLSPEFIQIIHQPDATIFHFTILMFIYSSTCFGRFPAHHQELDVCSGSLWFYLRILVTVVLCSWSGRPTAVVQLVEVLR